MGRCPKPRKFFEKNLTKNFHTWKVFGVHCALRNTPRVILSEGRSPQSNPEGVCVAQDLRGANEIIRPRSRHYASRSAFDSATLRSG